MVTRNMTVPTTPEASSEVVVVSKPRLWKMKMKGVQCGGPFWKLIISTATAVRLELLLFVAAETELDARGDWGMNRIPSSRIIVRTS